MEVSPLWKDNTAEILLRLDQFGGRQIGSNQNGVSFKSACFLISQTRDSQNSFTDVLNIRASLSNIRVFDF